MNCSLGFWKGSVRYIRYLLPQIQIPPSPNQLAINIAFVMPSAPDIGRKFQKLEGFEGLNRSGLLEIAQKVYNSLD